MTPTNPMRLQRAAAGSNGWVEPALPFVLLYGLAVFYGMGMLSPFGMSAVWVPNGVLIAALLLLQARAASVCLLGCFVVNCLASVAMGFPPVRTLTLSTVSFSEALSAVALTRLACGRNPDFADSRRLLAYVLTAASPACILSAGLVAGAQGVLHLPVPADAPAQWLISHLVGDAVSPPAVIVLVQFRRYRLMERQPLELVAAMAGVALAAIALFLEPVPAPLLALVLPMTFVAGFRYGPVGAAASALLIAAAATLSVALVFHPAPGFDLRGQVMTLQFFTALSLLTGLPAAGAVASHARMRAILRRRTETARAARRRADAAAAAKGDFLANMSHEIRTPLNGVMGLADALSRTELTPAQHEMLKMILVSGRALNGLLSDTLDLARADSGALKLVAEPFDVADTVGSAAYLFESNARGKGLDFRVRFDIEPPGAAVGDPLRIRQVVSNLISNAVKFTSSGSVEVDVRLRPNIDGRYRFETTVRDTGVGFDQSVKVRLFNRFEQGDSSVTRRFGGSGLGLAIAQRLAQMMGGSITCESTPGAGSVFTLSLPLPPASAAVSTAAKANAEDAPWRPERRLAVLLAEDHPVNRRVIQTLLSEIADLTLAEDGQAAIEAFATRGFDLILMDTHMPLIDGLSATRAIRESERADGRARTPIVSLTADALPQHVEAALAAGADLHLAKPITGEALFAAVQAALTGAGKPSSLAQAG